MFERNLYDVYGIYCESRFSIGEYEGFAAEGTSYILLPKEECMLSEEEMLTYTEYMRQIGDTSILQPIDTLYKRKSGLIDGQEVYVCPLPNDEKRDQHAVFRFQSAAEKGAHLAAVHHYGKQLSYTRKGYDFFGQWPKLWETRLEQLEGWYQQVAYQKPQSYVDEAFLFSYPYYMGLTENAIQYVVDATLDDRSLEQEKPTICHRRFNDRTWIVLSEAGDIVKKPTAFVYDHPCRDLAEWVRDQHWTETPFSWEKIESFIRGYEQYETLTTYSWKLLYARLLFPLHYFETIEDYYRSQLREEKIKYGQSFMNLLEHEHKNEHFLKEFARRILLSRGVGSGQVPPIDWL
ncbi:spore coat putative kinase YutH [Halalkalibacter akibai]|uniref:Spore coat protein S n=1 Tax=Halalkalibacter akibai (strain ATCC 43226 / DSM 21942 / CIP 109018 / JCM 9157 / 1139) TaxID=1236973 RepID=W4QMC6_HALA3|nr:spore coat protein YutH [Halalkalibacter akibai]GAE33275.1 spore coat protein S [Halalkalibacter akibai JCM 9157]